MKRKWLVVAALLAVAASVALGVLFMCFGGGGVESPVKPSPNPTHTPIVSAELHALESSLKSSKKDQQAKVLLPELRSAFLKAEGSIFPAGVTISIVQNTAWSVGDYGQMEITAGSSTYVARLVRHESQWLIFETEVKG